MPNAWVVIQPDDSVIIRVARSEMGQGSFTALPMMVAEELECDWSKVRAEFAPPHENLRRNRVWGDMSTGGSRAIRGSQDYLRKAGATAREMLIAAAAARWNVPASECKAANSVITHGASGRTLTFGAVAEAAAKIEPPAKVALKDPKDWKIAGKPTRRLDVPDKVAGKTIYGIDVQVPNMLHAAIMQSPVFKGTPKTIDGEKIRRMPGVRHVVKLDNAVAVVADKWWQAKKALDALPVVWNEGDNGKVSSASIAEFVRGGLSVSEAGIGRSNGDVAAALSGAARRIEADYAVPFVSHATMEPQNCTAHVTADKVEIWVGTQGAEGSLAAAASAAGLAPSKVVVHKTMVGGGFGRRGAGQDYVTQAVEIAKTVGQPVKLIWSREEDMRQDWYRPIAMARFTAALDAAGMPVALRVRLAGNSILATVPGNRLTGVDKHFQTGFIDTMHYDVPNYLVDFAMRNTHVPVGFWRGVNSSQNTFFKEGFIDELAHAAGQDPYQYRRKLLAKNAKMVALLDVLAKKSGWGEPLPQGVGRGIAIDDTYGSMVAHVVEASVGTDGSVKVHRVVGAIDSGHVVNPLTVEMQTEGSVVWAMTAALYGEITIKNGRVEQGNFDEYEMMRIAEMPPVETLIVPSGDFWGGVGEPMMAPFAPALCNAIFAATGKRVRSLPLKHHDLRKA